MSLLWRLCALSSVLILFGCARKSGAPELPESASFGWQLKSVRETGPKAWRAEYVGPGLAHVDVYETATGLDMWQKWKPVKDTVTFFNTRYFVVVSWEKVEKEPLHALVSLLEKRLAG